MTLQTQQEGRMIGELMEWIGSRESAQAFAARIGAMLEEKARSAYEQGYKDGFVDATITEDGFPDPQTTLKRVSNVALAEGWDAIKDSLLGSGPTGDAQPLPSSDKERE